MRASHEKYNVVAKNCSEFLSKEKENSMTNSISEEKINVSCENCHHFDENKFCKLDIYDKIVENHDF